MPTWDLLTGSVAGLVICIAFLYGTFKLDLVVPGTIYRVALTRIAALENENDEQHDREREYQTALMESRVTNARLEGKVETLTKEVSQLTETIRKLNGELEALRATGYGERG